MDNWRILVVDDNPALHDDFKKILFPMENPAKATVREFRRLMWKQDGPSKKPSSEWRAYELEFASQGEEAFKKVRTAEEEGKPYALAFVDIQMPPGWDGITTVGKIWEVAPFMEIVICTAYSDYSLQEMKEKLGNGDGFLILKKPFDSIEVEQMAHSLTAKYNLRKTLREMIQNQQTLNVDQVKAKLSQDVASALSLIQSNAKNLKEMRELDSANVKQICEHIEGTANQVLNILKK